MGDGGRTPQENDSIVTRYLESWGLREFYDEAEYYEWQQTSLSLQDLQSLQSLVEQRQGGDNEQADIQFYDLLAKPPLLSVLYSQRFDYFRQIGLLVSPRLSSEEHVLDFGCGVGILTCFFAQQHPGIQFMGVDRSGRSIEMAQAEAKKRRLSNVQFRVKEGMESSLGDIYDCILSTQALLQSEQEPGLPSQTWQTFAREDDRPRQEELERRTGLNRRFEALLHVLSDDGRMICFEKTWNLGRRIFFQRVLGGRKFFPVCDPAPCSYRELGETKVDGPLYEVSRTGMPGLQMWHEDPIHVEGDTLYYCGGAIAERMGRELAAGQSSETIRGQHRGMGAWTFQFGLWQDVLAWGLCVTNSGFRGLILGGAKEKSVIFRLEENIGHLTDFEFKEILQRSWGSLDDDPLNDSMPGYENHRSSAQDIYQGLPQKNVQQESTFADGQGKEMHIEIGTTKNFRYLYWANTFDQRQLVLMDVKGAEMLHKYYQESLETAQHST